MSHAELLADAFATIRILGWAFAGWLVVFAAIGTIVVLVVAATGTWVAKALWRRTAGPSWRRSAVRARILARRRVRPPGARSGGSDWEEAA